MERELLLKRFYKLNSSVISDALDSFGVQGGLVGINIVNCKKKMVGFAFTVKYDVLSPETGKFHGAGECIDSVPSDAVIVIDNAGRNNCTTWGGILTEFSISAGINGTVVYGSVRDVESIKETSYSVFSSHVFMQTGKNRVVKIDQQCDLSIGGGPIKPGDLVFGDANGCLVVPFNLAAEVASRAEAIEETEKLILRDISTGIPLKTAREKNNYAQAWLKGKHSWK